MNELTGIVKLREKNVVLEDIENPKLIKVLHSRLKKDKFNFFGYQDVKGYRESKGYPDYSDYEDYTDKAHTDEHSDRHTDKCSNYIDTGGSHPDYVECSRYSDHTDHGHSDHTDYWR